MVNLDRMNGIFRLIQRFEDRLRAKYYPNSTLNTDTDPTDRPTMVVEMHRLAQSCCCHIKIWMALILLLEFVRLLVVVVAGTSVFLLEAVDSATASEAMLSILPYVLITVVLLVEATSLHYAIRLEDCMLLLPVPILATFEMLVSFMLLLSLFVDPSVYSALFRWSPDSLSLFTFQCVRVIVLMCLPYAAIRLFASLQCYEYMQYKQMQSMPRATFFGQVESCLIPTKVAAPLTTTHQSGASTIDMSGGGESNGEQSSANSTVSNDEQHSKQEHEIQTKEAFVC